MRTLKILFLITALGLLAMTAGFVHSRFIVDQEFGPSSMLAALLLVLSSTVLFVSFWLVRGRHQDKVIGFWMVTVSSVGTYLAVDLLAGHLLITPLSPELVPDAVRHHKLVPNAHAKFDQKEFSYVQRNNKLGLRGAEVSLQKPDSTYRIIALGDSFTMGKGVEDDQTFSSGLQEILQNELDKCERKVERIEVLNAGVDSYSPLLAYLYLSQELRSLDWDLVIFNLDNSDLVQEAAYRSIALRDNSGAIIAVPGADSKRSISMRFRHWIENNLYMTRLLLFYMNKWLGHKDLSVQGVVTRANREVILPTLKADQVDRTQQWNDIFESLARIRDFADSRSSRFVMSVYPWGHQVNDDEWVSGRHVFMSTGDSAIENYDEKILALAGEYGIDAISLYDGFLGYEGDEPLYFAQDPHFTPRGQRLMAEETAQLLIERGYSEDWCK